MVSNYGHEKSYKIVWYYVLLWVRDTGNLVVSSSKYEKVRTKIKYILGETTYISERKYFSLYG